MPERGVARRLSAILVADLVGYTAQMRVDEKATYRQVKADLTTVFMPCIKAHRGRVVKTMGDGLLAEFASIVDCVECAMELQPEIGRRQEHVPEDSRFLYRIAVNVGDIIIERGDIYGDGVNLAARLQAMCERAVSSFPTTPTGRCAASSTLLSRIWASAPSRA